MMARTMTARMMATTMMMTTMVMMIPDFLQETSAVNPQSLSCTEPRVIFPQQEPSEMTMSRRIACAPMFLSSVQRVQCDITCCGSSCWGTSAVFHCRRGCFTETQGCSGMGTGQIRLLHIITYYKISYYHNCLNKTSISQLFCTWGTRVLNGFDPWPTSK